MICQECRSVFESNRRNKRFCCVKCKNIYHGREKANGLPLTPALREGLRDLADSHDVSENEMACKIIHQVLNPDGQPMSDEEIFGINNRLKK